MRMNTKRSIPPETMRETPRFLFEPRLCTPPKKSPIMRARGTPTIIEDRMAFTSPRSDIAQNFFFAIL